MSLIYPFAPQALQPAAMLPLTLISLEAWCVITVTGPDSQRYLQGQLTCDVNLLNNTRYLLGAQCDAKGKMWACFHLLMLGSQWAFLQRGSVCEAQQAALKQYAIFSQVNIAADPHWVLLGVAGLGARRALNQIFDRLPDKTQSCMQIEGGALLCLIHPAERFILILTPQLAEQVAHTMAQCGCAYNHSDQWLALDIEAGWPIIDSPNSGQLIPQAANLHLLEGISFTKGCYTGQEIVARAKYRGANRRALYWLTGTASRLPLIGGALELQLGTQWRVTGLVLAAVCLVDGSIWVQAVLNHDLPPDTVLRVSEDPNSLLQVWPLPYAISTEL